MSVAAVAQVIQPASEPDEIRPDPTFKRRFGLLSPEGKLYPVADSGYHSETFRQLVRQGAAIGKYYDAAGFLHLAYGDWSDYGVVPTQAQINALFEWQLANPGSRLPHWLDRYLKADT